MHVPKTVLDVMRTASGAAVAFAIGCSSSHAPIEREPAARLQPVAAIAAPAPAPAPPPAVVALPVATLAPAPPSIAALVDDVDAGAPAAHHRRRRPPTGTIGGIGNPDVMANCGRG